MIDWGDPCARAATLRAAYYRLIAGEQTYEFDYKSNEIERHMSFSRGDLPSLRTEIRIAEDACAVSQGVPVRGRRRAMVAGSVFPPGGFRW
jgi:hypothetical protein